MTATTFVQLSGLYLSTTGPVAGFDPAALLGLVLDRIAHLLESPAFCIVFGDLADDGAEAN